MASPSGNPSPPHSSPAARASAHGSSSTPARPATASSRTPPVLDGLPPEARFTAEAMLWDLERLYESGASSRKQARTSWTLTGVAASAGRCTGPVRVIRDESGFGALPPTSRYRASPRRPHPGEERADGPSGVRDQRPDDQRLGKGEPLRARPAVPGLGPVHSQCASR